MPELRPLATAPPKHRKSLFYGPPGAGKTFLAAKIAEALFKKHQKKSLFIDVDCKLESMENFTDSMREAIDVWTPTPHLAEGTDINIVRIDQKNPSAGYIPKNPKGYMEVVNFINELHSRDPFPWEMVCVDTITTLQEHLCALVMNHHKTSTLAKPHWGVIKNNWIEFFSGFLTLPCDRIVICHDGTREDDVTNSVEVRPALLGSYRNEIGKNFNEIYHFSGYEGGKYKVRTAASKKYLARTTKGFKEEELVDAVLEKI